MTTDEAATRICRLFDPDPRVQLVYLFGSRAGKSTADPNSDIDIAIYTTDDFGWDDYHHAAGEIPQVLDSGRFDLVWLNRADPVFRFDVVRSGRLMLSRSAETENAFEYRTTRAFWDYRLYLKRHMAAKEDRRV